jgi:hypothetical protein
MLTAAIGRAYSEQYDEPIVRLLDEVCFVPRPRVPAPRGFDPSADPHATHGNLDDLRKGLARLERLAPRLGVRVSAAVNGGWLEKHDDVLAELRALGVAHLRVGLRPEPEALPYLQGDHFRAAVAALAARGFAVTLVGAPEGFPSLSLLDYRPRFLRHRWASSEFYWIGWSIPDWVVERALS